MFKWCATFCGSWLIFFLSLGTDIAQLITDSKIPDSTCPEPVIEHGWYCDEGRTVRKHCIFYCLHENCFIVTTLRNINYAPRMKYEVWTLWLWSNANHTSISHPNVLPPLELTTLMWEVPIFRSTCTISVFDLWTWLSSTSVSGNNLVALQL